MKYGWALLGITCFVAAVIGCRSNKPSGCSTCGTAPTTTLAPPTAPVYNGQFIAPTQTYDPNGAVQWQTTPINGAPVNGAPAVQGSTPR